VSLTDNDTSIDRTTDEQDPSERPGAFTRRLPALVVTAIFLMAWLVVSVGRESPSATPVFAQAYGLGCTACHTQMPTLNAFGRYIQRSAYAPLNPKTLEHALPFFVFDIGSGYTAQSGQPQSAYRVNGPGHSMVFQANGALGQAFTYKVEQLIVAGGQPGHLDETWIAYNNLLNHRGHIFVGKLPEINLDEYADGVLDDATISRLANVAVGDHNYDPDYDGGRWGARFNYVGGKTLVQATYLGNPTEGNSFGDAYDFSRAAERSFQWRVAYADPARPWELGVFGESGSLGFTGTGLLPGVHVDNYNVITPYISKDPRPGSPGFRLEYSTATDSNPGYVTSATTPAGLQKVGPTASSWIVGSAYQMVCHDHGMVTITYYHTNQALNETGFTGLVQTTGTETGVGPGISYAVNPYTRFYTTYYVAQNQRPAFSISMWLTPPLWSRLK
jgi:hypothetical protein